MAQPRSYAEDLVAFNQVIPLMTTEDAVNGVWNSILAKHYFNYPRFIIKPEKYTKKGLKVDLVVTEVSTGKTKLVYEGKARGADAKFDAAIAQAQGYLEELNAKYAMVAVGTEVVFVTRSGSDVWEVKPVEAELKSFKGHNPLNINHDLDTIQHILMLIHLAQ